MTPTISAIALRAAKHATFVSCALACTLALSACGNDDPEPDTGTDTGEDAVDDAIDDTEVDADEDVAVDTDEDVDPDAVDANDVDPDVADTDAGDDTDVAVDVEEDVIVWPDPLTFDINWPIFDVPVDSLDGAGVQSCAIYQEETCDDTGRLQQCDIYDADTSAFVDAPDEMLERAYLYDRWYDLYMSPDGQTAERAFNIDIEPGTPEAVWGAPENLQGWAGAGDSAIWTGTALNAYILRYLHTGTEADYQRMEEKTRVMLRFFEVTGIPGYLSRYHYLDVPEGTVQHPDHIYHRGEYAGNDDHRDIDDPEQYEWLPEHYFDGTGTPRWSGDPSIDQMNGPMMAFPMVHGLLRDSELQDDLAYQMTCYLHNLRRIEIVNLQDNPDALGAVNAFFSGANVQVDADDIDFRDLDRVVMYVHPQINTANEDTYDRSCRPFIELEPSRVIDASRNTFIGEILQLTQDIDRDPNRPNHINHFYIPSIRGGDAAHMMHLSLMAYAFTGEERYADFLRDELLGNIRTAEVADTMSSLILPHYCRRFYGTNIIAGPLWAFNNLLADSELDTHMQDVMFEEMWMRECREIGNANFNLMFASAVDPSIGGAEREAALTQAVEILTEFGGNGGILNDPRRTYTAPYDDVVAAMPDGITPRCATEAERLLCEQELTVFGFTLDNEVISYECTGASYECIMEDGMCTTAEASAPLPPAIRSWADYTWQRNPFSIGSTWRTGGRYQSAGSDYAEQYWMTRFYDYIEGDTSVLAWRDTGEFCP